MRATLLGLFVGVLVAAMFGAVETGPATVYAQRQSGSRADTSTHNGLTALLGPTVEGQQLVLLMDPQRQTLATYQVEIQSGQISLRSVRNCAWDLQMDDFNGVEPSPEKIQALLRTRSLPPER